MSLYLKKEKIFSDLRSCDYIKNNENLKTTTERWQWLSERDYSLSEVILHEGPANVLIYAPDHLLMTLCLIEDLSQYKDINLCGLSHVVNNNNIDEYAAYGLKIVDDEVLSSLKESDFIIVISDKDFYEARLVLEKQTKANVILLQGLINLVHFKYNYYAQLSNLCKKHSIKLCILETPSVFDFDNPDLYDKVYKGEFSPQEYETNPQRFKNLYNDIPEYSDQYIKEIFTERPLIQKGRDRVHADCRDTYVNIINSQRLTTDQPENAQIGIYILGGCMAYGIGVDDGRTIASYLQKRINQSYSSAKNSEACVYNLAHWGASEKFYNDFMYKDNKRIKIAIVLCRADLRYPKGKNGSISRYIKNFMKQLDIEYTDLTQILQSVEEQKGTYIDIAHFNHRGHLAIAQKIYTAHVEPALKTALSVDTAEGNFATTTSQKWNALTMASRSLADFFICTGVKNIVLCGSSSLEQSAECLVEELQNVNVTIQYLPMTPLQNEDGSNNLQKIRRIDLDNLHNNSSIDLIIAIDEDNIVYLDSTWNGAKKTEVILLADLINLVYDKYFFYKEILGQIFLKNKHGCLVFWPSFNDLCLPAKDTKGIISYYSPEQIEKNYAHYGAYLYNEIPYFSKTYLEEIFKEHIVSAIDKEFQNLEYKGKYVNIANGIRDTRPQPVNFSSTIHIFGTSPAFGIGTEDRYTIASQLQEYINAYCNKEDRTTRRVVNEALARNGAALEMTIKEQITLKLDGGEIQEKDIILWFMDKRYKINEKNKTAYSYLLHTLQFYGFYAIDLTQTMRLAQKNKQVYTDMRHTSHRGYKAVATKLFFDYVKDILDDKHLRTQVTPSSLASGSLNQYNFTNEQNKAFAAYLDYLAKEKQDSGGTVGTIVMNCNPFTLGHRYLVEKAAKSVSRLYVFVVEEDQSFFPFSHRIKLVQEGLSDLQNVKVLSSGKFIISTITFPGYFTKDSTKEIAVDTSLDLDLFVTYIVPALNISARFVGEEPLCPITRQYNRAMRETLPQYGVRFIEYKRKEQGGQPISASRVRDLLEKGNFSEIRGLVPDTTYRYLIEHYKRDSKTME